MNTPNGNLSGSLEQRSGIYFARTALVRFGMRRATARSKG